MNWGNVAQAAGWGVAFFVVVMLVILALFGSEFFDVEADLE